MEKKTEIIRVKLEDPKISVFKESKEKAVSRFNFKLINHYKNGERVFVYPGGTLGGGQIGLLPKSYNSEIDKIKETVSYESDGKDIFLELMVEGNGKKPTTGKSAIGCLVLIVLAVIIIFSIGSSEDSTQLTEEQKKEKVITDQFSRTDGRHLNLQFFIEDNLNDPESFEHVETQYSVKEDHILIKMKYRARNKFNALILKEVLAKVDIETGKVLEILEDK